jgi:hypothetical protein
MLSRGESVIAVGLKASDEATANTHWRRFSPDASLSVTVNTSPNVPSSLDLVGAGGCSLDPARQWLNVPSLTASFITSDRDNPPDNVLGQVEVWARADRSLYVKTVTTALRGSPHQHTPQIINNTSNEHYWWRVRAQDAHGAWSAWSGWCNVIIDKTAPSGVTVTSSAFTPEGGVRVGQSGTLTLARAATDADVVGYRWGTCPVTSLECGVEYATTAVTTTTTATSAGITFTPTRPGPHRIVARAVDRAGNLGPPGHLDFYVDFVDATGVWSLNENAGSWGMSDLAGDVAGVRLDGASGSTWTSGAGSGVEPHDYAVDFDGVTGFATAPLHYVVDTSQSHAVAAHVRADSAQGRATILSIDGVGSSGLMVGFDDQGRLEYRLALAEDAPQGSLTDPRWAVLSATLPSAMPGDRWRHVAASYDAADRRMTLFLDGAVLRQTTLSGPTGPISAPGFIRLGRGHCVTTGGSCAPVDYLDGAVDNVRAYPFSVSEVQVRTWTSVAVPDPAYLRPGETLRRGDVRYSANGDYRLEFQADGNLVLHPRSGPAVWSSGTAGRNGDQAVMQTDGNLVVYAGSSPLWHTNTDGNPGALLRITNTGRLRVAGPTNSTLWQGA